MDGFLMIFDASSANSIEKLDSPFFVPGSHIFSIFIPVLNVTPDPNQW